ncbi:MAG: hypothetical protein C4289_08625, partial [Chloroflexota bacterium]
MSAWDPEEQRGEARGIHLERPAADALSIEEQPELVDPSSGERSQLFNVEPPHAELGTDIAATARLLRRLGALHVKDTCIRRHDEFHHLVH